MPFEGLNALWVNFREKKCACGLLFFGKHQPTRGTGNGHPTQTKKETGKTGAVGRKRGTGDNPNTKQRGTTKVKTSAAPQQGNAALKYPAFRGALHSMHDSSSTTTFKRANSFRHQSLGALSLLTIE